MKRLNLSVAQRISLAFALMIALVLAASGPGLFFSRTVDASISTSGAALGQLSSAADLEVAWFQVVASTDYMLLTRQTSLIEGRLQGELQTFNARLADIQALPDALGLGHAENSTILTTLAGLAEDLNATVTEVFGLAQEGSWTRAQALRHTELASLQRRFTESLTALREHTEEDVRASIASANDAQAATQRGWIGISALAIIVGGLAAFFTARSIIRPVASLVATAQAIQRGDTSKQAQVTGADELAVFGQTFNAMTAQLNESIHTLERHVSDLETANRERDRLIKQLEEAILFKDQFLATMSHELRTPLNAVLGYSALIQDEQDLPEDVYYMVNRIEGNSTRLLGLINDVLNISRINANRVEILARPIELRPLIHAWYDDFRHQADDQGLAFDLEIDRTLPPVIIGDEERLTQITANLLQNALKFTEKGRVGLHVRQEGDQLSIAVSDTGQGIPETWQHLIFDEFRQVDGSSKRKHGGAGLGLSIVKKLCLLMGGSVTVSSKLGVGSTFTLLLPLQTPAPELAAPAPMALAEGA